MPDFRLSITLIQDDIRDVVRKMGQLWSRTLQTCLRWIAQTRTRGLNQLSNIPQRRCISLGQIRCVTVVFLFFLLLQYADVSLTYFMTSPILSLRYCKDRVNNIYVFPRDDVEPISAEESSGWDWSGRRRAWQATDNRRPAALAVRGSRDEGGDEMEPCRTYG